VRERVAGEQIAELIMNLRDGDGVNAQEAETGQNRQANNRENGETPPGCEARTKQFDAAKPSVPNQGKKTRGDGAEDQTFDQNFVFR
jgi:hypothetical protein